MNREAPQFARYVLLLRALLAAPPAAPAPAPARLQAPRRAYTAEQRERFFALRAAGCSIGKAAKQMSIPTGTAKFWDQVWKGHR